MIPALLCDTGIPGRMVAGVAHLHVSGADMERRARELQGINIRIDFTKIRLDLS